MIRAFGLAFAADRQLENRDTEFRNSRQREINRKFVKVSIITSYDGANALRRNRGEHLRLYITTSEIIPCSPF